MRMDKHDLKPCKSRSQGFTEEATQHVGYVTSMKLGEGGRKGVQVQTSVVMETYSAYNAFLDQPALTNFRVALASWCLM